MVVRNGAHHKLGILRA